MTRAGARARVTCYLLHAMGSIADRLAALLAEMEESDRRLAALADDARELIARTDAMLAEDRPMTPPPPPTAGRFFLTLTGGSC